MKIKLVANKVKIETDILFQEEGKDVRSHYLEKDDMYEHIGKNGAVVGQCYGWQR